MAEREDKSDQRIVFRVLTAFKLSGKITPPTRLLHLQMREWGAAEHRCFWSWLLLIWTNILSYTTVPVSATRVTDAA